MRAIIGDFEPFLREVTWARAPQRCRRIGNRSFTRDKSPSCSTKRAKNNKNNTNLSCRFTSILPSTSRNRGVMRWFLAKREQLRASTEIESNTTSATIVQKWKKIIICFNPQLLDPLSEFDNHRYHSCFGTESSWLHAMTRDPFCYISRVIAGECFIEMHVYIESKSMERIVMKHLCIMIDVIKIYPRIRGNRLAWSR